MKVAVAHPDRLVREAIRRSLLTVDLSLLWSAPDERELERMRRRDPPDLVLLDAGLVGANGATVRGVVEAGGACLILSDGDRGASVYEALNAGALGHVPPPRLESDGELSGSARLISRIQRLQTLVGRPQPFADAPLPARHDRPKSIPLIAIGASTGGPQALARVLAALPAGLNAAVLIVQHIDGEFTDGLVEWLSSHCLLPVRQARRGDLIEVGQVYVGATQGHMVLLASHQIGYLAAQKTDLHVPSVDMLFSHLAESGCTGAAALLTGMGSDGAAGLLRLKAAGWHTIAQDEASCVVFGMPRAAVELGAAAQVLPLAAIGSALARHSQAGRP